MTGEDFKESDESSDAEWQLVEVKSERLMPNRRLMSSQEETVMEMKVMGALKANKRKGKPKTYTSVMKEVFKSMSFVAKFNYRQFIHRARHQRYKEKFA